jgi:tetratricopeptide (TPR) repeat protein
MKHVWMVACMAMAPLTVAAAESPRSDTKTDAGKALADEAAGLFKAGQYRQAAELFERSFALSPDKLVRLRNAGRAWEEAGRRDYACLVFDRYLAQAADGPEKTEVAQRVARLRQPAAASPAGGLPTATSPAVNAAATEPAVAARDVRPWAVMGAGVVAVAGGVVWLTRVADAADQVDRAERSGQYGYLAVVDRNRSAAWVTVGVGAAAVAAATVWHLWPRATVAIAPWTADAGATVAWRF